MRIHRSALLPLVLLLGACEAVTGFDGPDSDPPAISVGGLRSGDTVRAPVIQVDVTAEDRGGVVERLTFALNGAPESDLPGAGTAARITLRMQDLAVREGANQLVLSAFDDAGNRGTLAVEFVLAYRDSVATLSIEPDSVRLPWGTRTRLRAVVRNPSGRALDFSGPVAWTSSDTAAVAVSDSGTVTARAPGSATLTAAVGGRTDQARVTVPFPFALAVLEAPAGARTFAMAINDAGQVAGYAEGAAGQFQALLWTGGRAGVLGEGRAYDVNARGQVVGSSSEAYVGQNREPFTALTATMWSAGNRTLLFAPDLSSSPIAGSSEASAVNDAGDVVVNWSAPGRGGRSEGKVYLLRGGTLREVASAVGAEGSAINESGWIVGTTGAFVDQTQRAFVWRDGQTTSIDAPLSTGMDVSDAGEVVGGAYRAFRWLVGAVAFPSPLPAGSSEAEAVNARGDAAGWMGGYRGSDESRAFLWRQGGAPTDLNRLMQAGDWIFLRATDVNDRGQVVGYGKHRATGEIRALRADPVE